MTDAKKQDSGYYEGVIENFKVWDYGLDGATVRRLFLEYVSGFDGPDKLPV